MRQLTAYTRGKPPTRESNISLLIAEFPRHVRAFEENPAFRRLEQLEHHLATTQRRRQLHSVAQAVQR